MIMMHLNDVMNYNFPVSMLIFLDTVSGAKRS